MKRCLFLLLGSLVGIGQADAAPANIPTPQEELDRMTVRDGFELNLFASEPEVINPIAFQFDPQGRLWVLGDPGYPHPRPGARGRGRVVILEDTSGNGAADRSTVFVDGLLLPTGLALDAEGAYVAAQHEVLHFADTDGDSRADRRRVVLSGFGAGDSHTSLNNLQWSPTGALFMSQGLHSHHSRVLTPHGMVHLDRAGQWRWRPRTQRLEGFLGGSSGGNNPWGTVFDRWGQPFYINGHGGGLIWMTPALTSSRGQTRLGAFHAHHHHSGLDIIEHPHWPDALQRAFVAGGYRHTDIPIFAVEDEGAGYSGETLERLIRSSSETFRVVDVKIGPDGALYMADFAQEIIGHYEFSMRDPRRDREHGRIWRLHHRERPLSEVVDFRELPMPQLLDSLKSRAAPDRYQARRVLSGYPTALVSNAIRRWVDALDPDGSDYEHHLFEAFCVMADHGQPPEEWLDRLLNAEDFRARAFATRALGMWPERWGSTLERLEERIADGHRRVRLEAIVALTHHPSSEAYRLVLEAEQNPTDPFLDHALTQAKAALEPYADPAITEVAAQKPSTEISGRQQFRMTCAPCHGSHGEGLAEMAPSLVESRWVQEGPEILTRILLHGKRGEWRANSLMPPVGWLEEDQIAAVLNYVQNRWGDASDPTRPERVRQLRESHTDRDAPWTAEELEAIADSEARQSQRQE